MGLNDLFGRRVENPGPSRTAVATATHRAAHYIFDGEPKILTDPFARDLASFSMTRKFGRRLTLSRFRTISLANGLCGA
jgi:O-methyltransferase involved in polyketide biosynthesis